MRKIISEITLWIHLFFVLLLFLMFFFPMSVWPERPLVHFYIMALIIVSDLIFGIIYYLYDKKYFNLICVLTLIMQRIRGYKFLDERNYKHSFVREVCERLGFRVKRLFAFLLLLLMFILILVNYIIYILQ